MRTRALTKGLLTYVPGSRYFLPARKSSGTSSARYCYGTWIKHLTLLGTQDCWSGIPRTVAELGPGASLGIGIAALLSGSDRYYALDVTRRANTEGNLAILEDLLGMFRSRAGNPIDGWPDFSRYLDQGRFPSHLLSAQVLAESLLPERIAAIRFALAHPGSPADGIAIEYMVP